MKEVANINGVSVYSDKNVNSIINTKVSFTDGSWCDVSTGKIVNEGGGYIHFDNPDSKNSKNNITEEKEFFATKLHLLNTNANSCISVHNGTEIKVSINGPDRKVKNITCEMSGDTLKINDLNVGSAKGGINISGGSISISGISGTTIIANNNTIITGGNKTDITVNVKVPKGTNIKAEKINGNLSIDDTEGNIELSTNSANLTAGSVKNAILNVHGSGDITVSKVTGNLTANVKGSGNIKIKKGDVPNLLANIQGSGDIKFGGNADNANLSIMGSGDIDVNHVRNQPITSIMGSGDININNW